MKGKLLIIILTLSLAVNASAVATIGYHYWRNTCLTPSAPCPLNQEDHHPYQELGLSAEQLAKMTSLAQSFHGRLNQLEGAVETKRNLLIDCLGEKRSICRGPRRSGRKSPVIRMKFRKRSSRTSRSRRRS